ncbi:MAG: dTDP-glucose 4,6-dehydratase [Bdellovibrio sp.]
MAKQILVTGAAGFIGSTFVRVAHAKGYKVTVLDSLTYAGHLENLSEPLAQGSVEFIQGDIRDFTLLDGLFAKQEFTGIINFAAESHVDNSISGPRIFVETNVVGTLNLLEVARKHWPRGASGDRRFLQVSTDEVFGALGETGQFSESTPYQPNSPYSASKAGADHLVRAWFHTYGLPTITTNCSNNYGPRQYPEKLIPVMIQNALKGRSLPVYGKGLNVRDWIHVEDHSRGVLLAFERGTPGESYCFGGNSERTNLQLVKSLCSIMDELAPRQDGQKHESGIQFVQDRAGHDFRYAIDDSRAQKELGFVRKYADFEKGLRQTIEWYIQNQTWVGAVQKKNARS